MKGKATTLNMGVINAGDWPSTVPALCILECRIGFPPGETREIVINQVEKTVQEVGESLDRCDLHIHPNWPDH